MLAHCGLFISLLQTQFVDKFFKILAKAPNQTRYLLIKIIPHDLQVSCHHLQGASLTNKIFIADQYLLVVS